MQVSVFSNILQKVLSKNVISFSAIDYSSQLDEGFLPQGFKLF